MINRRNNSSSQTFVRKQNILGNLPQYLFLYEAVKIINYLLSHFVIFSIDAPIISEKNHSKWMVGRRRGGDVIRQVEVDRRWVAGTVVYFNLLCSREFTFIYVY